ncbi:MAG: hypothetical protein R3F20_02155 [Planctomycetota bacterium]
MKTTLLPTFLAGLLGVALGALGLSHFGRESDAAAIPPRPVEFERLVESNRELREAVESLSRRLAAAPSAGAAERSEDAASEPPTRPAASELAELHATLDRLVTVLEETPSLHPLAVRGWEALEGSDAPMNLSAVTANIGLDGVDANLKYLGAGYADILRMLGKPNKVASDPGDGFEQKWWYETEEGSVGVFFARGRVVFVVV